MKSILKLFLIGMVCVTLRADILRLRDGRLITGQFLGATKTEIWFRDEVPGNIIGAAAYPVEQVESLTFGPAPGQAKASIAAQRCDRIDLRRPPRRQITSEKSDGCQ